MMRGHLLRTVQRDVEVEKPEHWTEQGLCAQAGGDAWYPEKGHPTANAKALCAVCPVRAACLEDALERNDQWGVWGGKSLRERQAIRKARNAA